MDLLVHLDERDRRLADALGVIVSRGDARVLAAVGVIVDFALKASWRTR